MTESEWLTTTDHQAMRAFLTTVPMSDRKVRLFRVAVCRCLWKHLTLPETRRTVEAVEAFVDGHLSPDQFHEVSLHGFKRFGKTYLSDRNVRRVQRGDEAHRVRMLLTAFATDTATAGEVNGYPLGDVESPPREDYHPIHQLTPDLLRELLGNPLRTVVVDPRWLSPTVTALANGIYTNRAFDRLPILADALEEAGCDHADILNHCRSPGPHVKGCWVVDLVLGKE